MKLVSMIPDLKSSKQTFSSNHATHTDLLITSSWDSSPPSPWSFYSPGPLLLFPPPPPGAGLSVEKLRGGGVGLDPHPAHTGRHTALFIMDPTIKTVASKKVHGRRPHTGPPRGKVLSMGLWHYPYSRKPILNLIDHSRCFEEVWWSP